MARRDFVSRETGQWEGRVDRDLQYRLGYLNSAPPREFEHANDLPCFTSGAPMRRLALRRRNSFRNVASPFHYSTGVSTLVQTCRMLSSFGGMSTCSTRADG